VAEQNHEKDWEGNSITPARSKIIQGGEGRSIERETTNSRRKKIGKSKEALVRGVELLR